MSDKARNEASAREAPIRIGAVSYANTRPLIHGLQDAGRQRAEGYRLVLDTPAGLAGRLARDQIDVGLISVAEYLRREYLLLDAGCISSFGPATSVRLFSPLPIRQVRRIRLDPASRSSNDLARVLARHLWMIEPEFVQESQGNGAGRPHPEAVDDPATASLLIGDAALRRIGQAPHEYDLGEAWAELTRFPFVFAVWATRRDCDLRQIPDLLRDAAERGRQSAEVHAREAAGDLGLPEELLRDYLTRDIEYELGSRQLVGIEMFYRMLRDMRLAEPFAGIEFYTRIAAPAR